VSVGIGASLIRLAEAPFRWLHSLSARWQDRVVGAGLLVPGLIVLGVARYLTPDPSGMETHRQLGLGRCTFLSLFEVPCPMCGMTTTFSLLAHFRPLDALVNQPFGVCLFAVTVTAVVIGGLDLLAPGGQRWRRALGVLERHEMAAAMAILGGMSAGWLYKTAQVTNFLSLAP